MTEDCEFEMLVTTPKRLKALGFKPQKEVLLNHMLPYAHELDVESNRFLEQVKTNLAKSVMLREMKPACCVWSSRLMKYIRLYGLKFGKEDHIALIKLTYELVLIPDLEPGKVHKFATLFSMLTKKRHLISPEELTLPWRPLYEMGQKIFDTSATRIGMYHYLKPKRSGKQGGNMLDMIRKFLSGDGLSDALELFGLAAQDENEPPTSLESSYVNIVKCARPYFHLNATKELLAELLPRINPWSRDTHVMLQLVMFLPVSLPPRHAADGHLLWLDTLMDLWDTCYKSNCGVSDLLMVFSELARQNPGAVDWSPHVPKMFMSFFHALNLPVSYKEMQITKSHALYISNMSLWIVWTINPDGLVLKHLRSFLAGVESYLHSANTGRWTFKLRELISKLANEFLNRVRREREKKFTTTWMNQTPNEYKLRDEDITEFVTVLLEPALQTIYSKSGGVDISIALQNLATLRPALVMPPLLERLKTALTSLTEPHRVTAAMSAVAYAARPMLRGADAGYPEGPTHVVPFLMAVLPGLDPNDMKKTIITLHYVLMFSYMMPFIDCSSAHEHWPDLTEEELLTCESTAQLEDFVLVFLDRLFVLIESSVLENVRLDTIESDWARSKTDAVLETAISSAATTIIMQCSPKIFSEALRKFKSFATETTFETNVSASMVGVLLRVFARVNGEATLSAFLPKLCEELKELLSTDEALREANPPRDLMYRLVLLLHLVQCDGTVLLKYIPDILPILDRALKLHTNYALQRACEILSHIFTRLCYIDLIEWRSSPKDYGAAPEKWLPIRDWGHGCLMKDAELKWHLPSVEEAACAQMLLDRYLKPEVCRLRQWLSGERPMCRDRRLRSFSIISAVLMCSTFLPLPDEEPVKLVESQVPATSIPLTYGVRHKITLDGKNVRVELTKLLVDVQDRMLADKTDDTRSLETLTEVWERILVIKGLRAGMKLEARLRSKSALDRALDGRGGPSGGFGNPGSATLRMLIADRVRLHDLARFELVCEAGITPSGLKALYALCDLCLNTYTTVRVLAQVRLFWMLNHYPYSYRTLVPKLAALLAEGGEGDEWHARHKGALYMLFGPRAGPLVAKQDWEVIRMLWPAILKAPVSENTSIIRIEHAFSDTLHRQFPTVNTRLSFTRSAVDAASTLLTEAQATEAGFVEKLSRAAENEIANSDRIEKLYLELIDEIINVVETPNIQWRRLELAMQMLTFCPSPQTAYPARAVRAAVRGVVHDDIAVRRTAHQLTHFALKQRKRKVKKVSVDPYDIAGVPKPDRHVPGYRKDLEWAIWSEDKIPKTDEDWEKPWLRSNAYGFFAWPEKIQVAAPSSEQVCSSDLRPEEMEEGERHLYEFFNDDGNVERLVTFNTVEEKKGKDKFNGSRFSMFRMLFAQFGEQIADKYIGHAKRCAADSHESRQRFAAEIAAAALRAPRYWSRVRAQAMYQHAIDILEAGLTSVTVESMEDWGTCLATGVEKLDPNRGGSVLSALVELCVPPPALDDVEPDNDTSFVVAARLYAVQGIIGSLKWRVAPLAAQLLNRLEAAYFTQHPYQNVRENVGSMLMSIFDTELVFPGGGRGGAPCLADFLRTVQPRLAILYDESGDIVIKPAASLAPGACGAGEVSGECSPPAAQVIGAPLVTQVGQVEPDAVDVVRLSPEAADTHEPPQQRLQDGSSESSCARGSRLDAQLAAGLQSALRLSGDAAPPPPAPRDHARAVSLLTTVLRGCTGVVVRNVYHEVAPLYAMAGAACALAARGPPQPNDELPRAAAVFLASVALANHSRVAFDTALAKLDEFANGRSWWARLACLDFAQPVLFYGLPMLCDQPERAERVERFALKLMRDPRLEVRQSAAKLLTGLMHCRALLDEERTLRGLMRSCRSKALVERHCGVLGLCAYLSSRPYSLGPQLGSVLAELSRHTSAPDPIPATIRAALADFRRTHQDDWPQHRERLSEEELDLLADLTSPPTYCA